jgi:hypothetical protein
MITYASLKSSVGTYSPPGNKHYEEVAQRLGVPRQTLHPMRAVDLNK